MNYEHITIRNCRALMIHNFATENPRALITRFTIGRG
jgi:hypothetical protein